MNALITSASRKVTLIRAFQDALDREGGGDVIAVDASKHSAALYEADAYEIAPYGLGDEFARFIRNVVSKYNVSIIIPTRDEELPFFAARQDEFNESGVKVMVPSRRSVEICQDKLRFIKYCTANGFQVPKVFETSELETLDTFPVFVRGRLGKGSEDARRVETRKELEVAYDQIDNPVVQEYVDAPEFTIDLFANFDGEVISVVPRERVRVFGGESFVGRTVRDDQMIKHSAELSESVGLVGHNTFQCFQRDSGDIQFIEINPRYGGGASLGFAAGAFTPRYLVRLFRDKSVPSRVGDFAEGRTMLRYTRDLFLDEEGQPISRPW